MCVYAVENPSTTDQPAGVWFCLRRRQHGGPTASRAVLLPSSFSMLFPLLGGGLWWFSRVAKCVAYGSVRCLLLLLYRPDPQSQSVLHANTCSVFPSTTSKRVELHTLQACGVKKQNKCASISVTRTVLGSVLSVWICIGNAGSVYGGMNEWYILRCQTQSPFLSVALQLLPRDACETCNATTRTIQLRVVLGECDIQNKLWIIAFFSQNWIPFLCFFNYWIIYGNHITNSQLFSLCL